MKSDSRFEGPLSPQHGRSTFRGRTILLIAYFDPIGLMTVRENIAAWTRASSLDFQVLNLWKCKFSPLRIPAHVDLNDYAGVMIHPAACYFPSNLFSLDTDLKTKFADYDGLKILVKQDEHFKTHEFGRFIKDNKFDILVTCLPPEEVEKAYTAEAVEGVTVIRQLTAFVSDPMRTMARRPYNQRPLDISYRGSLQPLICGRLGLEKWQIGEAVREPAEYAGLRVDISSRWEDRIHGEAWTDFLASSKAVLGVESGSNLFDFDGSVTEWCDAFAHKNADLDEHSEAYYQKAHKEYLHKFEGNIDYAQVSPRHFEAAATGTLQILYEGRYSGIFIPHRHFFPLKRDLSNIKEAFDLIRDKKAWTEMTNAAFEEIVLSDKYTYNKFVETFDQAVITKFDEKGLSTRPASHRQRSQAGAPRRALIAMYHDPDIDPRVTWLSESLEERGYEVVELGVHHDPTSSVDIREVTKSRIQVRSRLVQHTWPSLKLPVKGEEFSKFDYLTAMMAQCIYAPNSALQKRFGAEDPTQQTENFRHVCMEMINGPSILLDIGRELGDFDIVVGVDLHGLTVATILAEELGAVSVYDAHEYWPAARSHANWEFDFWTRFERLLVEDVDISVTVSKPLVEIMSAEYGKEFRLLPNCASRSAADPLPTHRVSGIDFPPDPECGQVIFLFHGGLHPERPVDFLVESWPKTDERAVLWLRALDSPLRDQMIEMARRNGLLNKRIFFPKAAKEDELIESAKRADVGIIPYSRHKALNHMYASPNKFSQYMAAGIPTLATDLVYVRSIVEEQGIGRIYDTLDPEGFAAQVNWFVTHPDERKAMGEKAKTFFESTYNWRVQSAPLLDAVDEKVAHREPVEKRPLASILSPFELEKIDAETAECGMTYGWPNYTPAPTAPEPVAEPTELAPPKSEPEAAPVVVAAEPGTDIESYPTYRVAEELARRFKIADFGLWLGIPFGSKFKSNKP